MEQPVNVMDLFSLKGKVAVITGGAGLYGRQAVTALAQAGARTYIAARHLDKIEAVAAEERANGHEVFALELDQGDEASILRLRDEILRREARVDILVNNAVLRVMKGWDDTVENFETSIKVNVTGVFLITRAFGNEMARQGGGSIINIGSTMGSIGPDLTLYAGTDMGNPAPDYFIHKGGMLNFTRYVASIYGSRNVRCNCISPGGFGTPNHRPDFRQRYNDRTFLGRMANDTDLMGAIVYLASAASSYVTGANLPLDGGYTAK